MNALGVVAAACVSAALACLAAASPDPAAGEAASGPALNENIHSVALEPGATLGLLPGSRLVLPASVVWRDGRQRHCWVETRFLPIDGQLAYGRPRVLACSDGAQPSTTRTP